MTYTIAVKPSQTSSKVTATSSDGHSLTTATPLLDTARYWLNNGANPADTITTAWSSSTTPYSLRSTIAAAANLRVVPSNVGRPIFKPINEVDTAKDNEI